MSKYFMKIMKKVRGLKESPPITKKCKQTPRTVAPTTTTTTVSKSLFRTS